MSQIAGKSDKKYETREKKSAAVSDNTKQLIAYFLLAYGISWLISIPLALANQGLVPQLLPSWTHYLAAFGPMLSALIVTWASHGGSGVKELFQRMFKWRACPKWWIVAFSPLIIGFLVFFILGRLSDTAIGFAELGTVNYLPPLGLGALLLWIFAFGLGQETGWRGFALPRLKKGRSALAATMILTIFWALWYLPQFFYLMDPADAMGWLIGMFAASVILTWLYSSANHSILMAAIWHGCLNFVLASKMDTGILPIVMTVLLIIGAVFVIVRYNPKYLTSI